VNDVILAANYLANISYYTTKVSHTNTWWSFRYISGRHVNAYSHCWVLRRCITELSFAVRWWERL